MGRAEADASEEEVVHRPARRSIQVVLAVKLRRVMAEGQVLGGQMDVVLSVRRRWIVKVVRPGIDRRSRVQHKSVRVGHLAESARSRACSYAR